CHLLSRHTPRSTLFPYTTLFRSERERQRVHRSKPETRERQNAWRREQRATNPKFRERERKRSSDTYAKKKAVILANQKARHRERDRKSTRLNSSHVKSSYAVFCL